MANQEIRIKFKIDSDTKEIVLLNNEVKKVGESFNNADTFANTFMKRINIAGHIYAGYQALNHTLGDIYSTGIKVNREFQNLNNSLSMMIVVSSKNVDSMGNILSMTQKQELANKEASKSLDELLRINAKTPHTFEQTVKLYDSMYLGMRKVGASSQDMVEITEKLSIAVGNKVSFEAMLSAMDGLSTGTVEVASDMGRFLKAIGLSNEEIKNSSNVVELFKDKLSDFKAVESFDTKLSNLTNSYNLLSKTLSESVFEELENSMTPAAKALDKLNASIIDYKNNIEKVQDIHKQNNIKILEDELKELEKKLTQAQVATERFYNKFRSGDEAEVKKFEMLIKATQRKINDLKKAEKEQGETVYEFDDSEIKKLVNETLNPYQAGLDEINKKWKTHYDLMSKNGFSTVELIKAWTQEIDTFNEKSQQPTKAALKEQIKEIEQLNKAYLEMTQVGLSEYDQKVLDINLKTQSWIESGVELNEALKAQELMIKELDKQELEKLNKGLDKTNDSILKLQGSTKSWLDTLFEGFDKAMDNQIFDALSGKFDSASGFFSDFGSSIKQSIYKSTAGLLQGGVSNIAKSVLLGSGLSTPTFSSASEATSWLASNASLLTSDGYSSAVSAISEGNFEKVSSIVNNASNLNSAYSMATNGLTATMYAPSTYMGSLAGSASAAGYGTAANFFAGSANVLGGGSALGTGTVAGAVGGVGTAGLMGYAIGSIGDKLFGAQTQAANYAAIGAMIGSVVPAIGTLIGAAIGAVIGGFIGSTKLKHSGLYVHEGMSATNADGIYSYARYQKKSWFSSSSWDEVDPLDNEAKKEIQKVFNSYNYMLKQMGELHDRVQIYSGKYPNNSILDEFNRSLIANFMDIPQHITQEFYINVAKYEDGFFKGITQELQYRTVHNPKLTEVYKVWSQYAASMKQSVQEALFESIGEFVSYKREFEIFALNTQGKSVEALKTQLSYLKEDFNNLAKSLDASGVTVDNFNSKMRAALKDNFTPEALSSWQNLGDSLKEITNATKSYNDALAQQKQALYEQNTQLNQTQALVALDQYNYDLQLKNYKKTLSSFASSTVSSFTGVFKTILGSIKNLKDSNQNTLEAMGENDVGKFWELDKSFQSNLNGGNIQEAQRIFSSLQNVANALNESDSSMGDSFKSYFEENIKKIDLVQKSTTDVLIEELGSLLGINSEVVTAIKNSVFDGKIYSEDLTSISKDLSPNQAGTMQSALESLGILGSKSGGNSLQELAKFQLEQLKLSNADQTKDLNADTFKYLAPIGVKEQYDLAFRLGKTFEEVEAFVYNLQSFDIKDAKGDLALLKNMLNYQVNDGKASFDANALKDLTALKDVLPQDIKNAYNAFVKEFEQTNLTGLLQKATANTQTGHIKDSVYKYLYDAGFDTKNELSSLFEKINSQTAIVSLSNEIEAAINLKYGSSTTSDDRLLKLDAGFGGWAASPLKYGTTAEQLNNDIDEMIKSFSGIKELTRLGLRSMYQDYALDKGADISAIKSTFLPSFSVGSAYIPNDMTANIHQGEKIIDPVSSNILNKYGIKLNLNSANDSLVKAFAGVSSMVARQNELLKELLKTNKQGNREQQRATRSDKLYTLQGSI